MLEEFDDFIVLDGVRIKNPFGLIDYNQTTIRLHSTAPPSRRAHQEALRREARVRRGPQRTHILQALLGRRPVCGGTGKRSGPSSTGSSPPAPSRRRSTSGSSTRRGCSRCVVGVCVRVGVRSAWACAVRRRLRTWQFNPHDLTHPLFNVVRLWWTSRTTTTTLPCRAAT